jgi:UDP-N-acetylmuramoyl-tripeptide--D-alanyl-D-alanine ligase
MVCALRKAIYNISIYGAECATIGHMFLRSILDLYSLSLSSALVVRLRRGRYSGWRLLYWFWHTTRFRAERELTEIERSVAVLLSLGMLGQIVLGIGFLVQWARYGTTGSWEFGAALLLSYPLVWTHIVVVVAWVWNLVWAVLHPKKAARSMVCTVLEMQVRQLRARHHFKVVAVAGSVGKTSTKLAVAELLGQTLRVRYQAGNYNDRVTVPLVFFGLSEPSLYNVVAWIKAFGVTQSEIALPYPYDVVVVELGTDGPGQLEEFGYLRPDITVLTAVSEEHMENFGTLDRVAAEELRVFDYSKQVLVNGDDIAAEYLAGRDFTEYSLKSEQAQYLATSEANGLQGQKLDVRTPHARFSTDIRYLGDQGAKVALAAAAVADLLGVKPAATAKGLAKLEPFSGRMQVLKGVKNSTLIDDTYKLVGAYCDPKKLDVVVTIGKDAKKWLAPAARERGCTVHSFDNPYDAGAYVSGKIQKNAVVLAKGSQNGVFAEEALKSLLVDPTDSAKLVRQSVYWMLKKQRQFGKANTTLLA